jgi:hypothetical protein
MANPAIVTPEMAGKVLSTLADPRWDVRESGLKIVLTLAQQGKPYAVGTSIVMPTWN